jgi:hypothetical protein
MSSYRKNPTWAILPSSKTLPGSKALELLGCVVADIENPTDHCVPRDLSTFRKQLPRVLEVEDTDAKLVLSRNHASHIDTRLTQVLNLDLGQQSCEKRDADTQTVITRFLVDHPSIFKVLVGNEQYERDILEMMDLNPINRKTAYMVVGVKTCLDMKLSDIRTFQNHTGGGAELPIDEALAASGIVLPPGLASLDIAANAKRSRTRDLLSTYTAVGERVFAIQYRQIKRHRDWLKWTAPTTTLRYGDLEHVSSDVGLFGDSDQEYEACEEDGEEVIDDSKLEIGDGIGPGSAVGNLVIAEL